MSARLCGDCGAPATPTARFCTKCGASLPEPAETPPPVAAPAFAMPMAYAPGVLVAPKTSGLAITSLVFGILSYVLVFGGLLTAPIALITGMLGLRQIGDPASMRTGRGMAIAGVILGLVFMIIATVLVSLFVWLRNADLR